MSEVPEKLEGAPAPAEAPKVAEAPKAAEGTPAREKRVPKPKKIESDDEEEKPKRSPKKKKAEAGDKKEEAPKPAAEPAAAAAAAAAPAPEKKKKKRSPRGSSKHPPFIVMMLAAIKELKSPTGSSLKAIEGYVTANYDLGGAMTVAALRAWLRITARRGVSDGYLRHDDHHPNSFRATEAGRVLLKKNKTTTKKLKKPKKKKAAKKEDEAPAPAAAGGRPKRVIKKKKFESDDEEEYSADEEVAVKRKMPARKKKEKKKKEKEGEGTKDEKKAEAAPKKKKPRKPAAAAAAGVEKKVVADVPVAADIVLTGVAFNTTDIPQVREDVKSIIKTLLQDDNTTIGIVANRGAGEGGAYKLETLDFRTKFDQISAFIEGSFGEGSDWLGYYRMVLESAAALPWAKCRGKYLILVGNDGLSCLRDPSLQAITGRLETLGVRVFGFHHSQLDLLQATLHDLH